MRKIGLDYGEARVGVAITDELNITVQGLETIQRNNSDKIVLRRLDEILEQSFVYGFCLANQLRDESIKLFKVGKK